MTDIITPTTAQSQVYATVSGIAGTWAVVDIPEYARSATKVRDGGANNSETILSKGEWGDMPLSRPFMRNRDIAGFRRLVELAKRGYTCSVTVIIEDENGVIEDRFTFTGRLMRVKGPSGDSMSSSSATVDITIALNGMAS